jgi:transketolase
MLVPEKQIQKYRAGKAQKIRETIIEMLVAAGSGHTAGPLGMADIFATFYFQILKHDPHNPAWPERDRLILSNGHITPVRYAAMAHAGYFPVEECLTLRKFGTRLQGHPERTRLPALRRPRGRSARGSGKRRDMHMARAWIIKNLESTALCLMASRTQGTTWESAMFAGNNKLHNLTAVIDRNNIQINGMTETVMPLENLRKKYEAFNWHAIEVDGHNIREIIDAVDEAKAIYEKPTVIIAHTIPGKGIKEIEFDYTWHGKPPSKEEAKKFLHELRTMKGKIKGEHE